MTTNNFTAQQSADEFRNKSAMAFFATDSANSDVKTDAANLNLGSLQAQLQSSLVEQIRLMAQLAENDDAQSLLTASRKAIEALPEKAATTNSSRLFSSSARHAPATQAADDNNNTTFTIG